MEFNKKYSTIIIVLFVLSMIFKPVFCFLILGILVLCYSVSYLLFLNDIQKNGIESPGKIMLYESDDEGYKTPIVEFKTAEGELVQKKPYYYASSDLSKFRTYKNNLNKSVIVLYSQEKPEKFIIKSEREFNYGTIVFCFIVSLFFVLFAIGCLTGYLNVEI